MKRDMPAYVYRVSVKGKTYFYFRRNGVNARVDPVSPTFWVDYARLRELKPTTLSRRNFNALVASYRRSDRFKKLKPRTVKDYEPVLSFISERYGRLIPARCAGSILWNSKTRFQASSPVIL